MCQQPLETGSDLLRMWMMLVEMDLNQLILPEKEAAR